MLIETILLSGVLAGAMADPPHDLLRGPEVREEAAPLTIVTREFDGTLRALEDEPHVAAIGVLDLSPEQRAQLEEIVTQRAAVFDRAVRDHYGLIVELTGAFQGATPRQRLAYSRQLREAFEAFIDRGTTLDEMRDHLEDEQITEVERMVTEFVDAKIESYGAAMDEAAPRARLLARMQLQEFGRQIRQSIERQIAPSRELFEQMLIKLNVTPEQESKIRAIVQTNVVRQFQGKMTTRERRERYGAIREVLTAEQQATFYRLLVEQWRDG